MTALQSENKTEKVNNKKTVSIARTASTNTCA